MNKYVRHMLILMPLILPVFVGATNPPNSQYASMLPNRFLEIAPNPLLKLNNLEGRTLTKFNKDTVVSTLPDPNPPQNDVRQMTQQLLKDLQKAEANSERARAESIPPLPLNVRFIGRPPITLSQEKINVLPPLLWTRDMPFNTRLEIRNHGVYPISRVRFLFLIQSASHPVVIYEGEFSVHLEPGESTVLQISRNDLFVSPGSTVEVIPIEVNSAGGDVGWALDKQEELKYLENAGAAFCVQCMTSAIKACPCGTINFIVSTIQCDEGQHACSYTCRTCQ